MIALPLVLLLATLQPAPATLTPDAASPAPLASGAPSAGPPGVASPLPAPAPSASPQTYAYRFVPKQPENPPPGRPQIFAIYLNSKKLKSQGPIDIKVSTTPNVVKVLTRSNGREGTVPMIAPGDFEAKSVLPKLPFVASGISTNLEFIAVGSSGERVTVPVPITLQ